MTTYNIDNVSIEIVSLGISDYHVVSTFIKNEKEFVPPGFFFTPPDKILFDCLASGLSIAATFENEIIGIRLTYLPGLANDNHGKDLGLSDLELNKVAQFQGTIVKSDMRFKGLGDHLVKMNCKQISDKGYDYILVTAHPKNINSIKMLLSNEFSIRRFRMKYNGLPRFIFLREMAPTKLPDNGEIEFIELSNLSLIADKLERGCEGIEISENNKLKIRLRGNNR